MKTIILLIGILLIAACEKELYTPQYRSSDLNGTWLNISDSCIYEINNYFCFFSSKDTVITYDCLVVDNTLRLWTPYEVYNYYVVEVKLDMIRLYSNKHIFFLRIKK